MNHSLRFVGILLRVLQTTTSNITMKTWGDVEIMVTYGTIGLILALFVGAWCNLLSLQDKTAKT